MQRQIYLLTALRAIRMFMITLPIIVLYWQSHGLTIQDIFILQVIYSVAVVVLEIPTGYFADRFGHKKSLLLGSVLSTLGFFCYYAFPSYAGFICAEILLALSTSFVSGARDALLYDTLQKDDKTTLYTKYQGRIGTIGAVSEALAALCAGLIASISSIGTVLLIQWLIMSVSIPIAWMLREIKSRHEVHTPPLLKILRGNFKENKRLLYLNIYAGGISAATLVMVWFAQPHWQMLKIDVLYFGYLWMAFNLFVGIGSFIAYKLEKVLSFRVLFGTLALLPLLLYFSIALFSTSLWVLLIVPGFWLLRGVITPIIQDYVQRECQDGERATVLSINALVGRLIFSIFSPFVGWIADVWDLTTAFYASGVIFGCITLISFLFLFGAMIVKTEV